MEDKKFIDKIIIEGNLNLRKNYKELGITGVRIPYSNKAYRRIKKLQEEINKKAMKQREPFKISTEDKDLEKGEVRFRYL